jgi:uncharacterized protein (TIGR00725 family)
MARASRTAGHGSADRPPAQVAVSGGGVCPPEVARLATALGSGLADLGAIVVCGGLGGVMAAVARGARRHGGTVVGILPDYERGSGNRYLNVSIPTGLGHGRNVLVAASGDVLVALPGAAGTLSEIAIALRLGRPVIGLGAWTEIPGVHAVADVPAAIAAVRAALAPRRTGGNGRRRSRGFSPRRVAR